MADLVWDNSYWATTVKLIDPSWESQRVMACERWCGDGGQRCPRKTEAIACRKPREENRNVEWTHIPRPFAHLPTVPRSPGSTALKEGAQKQKQFSGLLFLHLPSTPPPLRPAHPHTTSLSPKSSLEDALASALVARRGRRERASTAPGVCSTTSHPTHLRTHTSKSQPWVAIDN
jgi:hypothetical protein